MFRTITNKLAFILLYLSILFSSSCAIVNRLNADEKKTAGDYFLSSVFKNQELNLYPNKTFFLKEHQDLMPNLYCEGKWNVRENYLILYFEKKPKIKKTSTVTEEKRDSDSIQFKISVKGKPTSDFYISYKSNNEWYYSGTNKIKGLTIKKQDIDSIIVSTWSSEPIRYRVKNIDSNYFLFNTLHTNGIYRSNLNGCPSNVCKLLILGDKLCTEEALRDSTNWLVFSLNHYERKK